MPPRRSSDARGAHAEYPSGLCYNIQIPASLAIQQLRDVLKLDDALLGSMPDLTNWNGDVLMMGRSMSEVPTLFITHAKLAGEAPKWGYDIVLSKPIQIIDKTPPKAAQSGVFRNLMKRVFKRAG